MAVEPPLKKRAPTLYAIIVFKLIKGLLCVALALVLYHEAKNDLSDDWDKFLQSPVVTTVFGELRIHPESKFFMGLADNIALLTEAKVHRAALGAVAFEPFSAGGGDRPALSRLLGWLAGHRRIRFLPPHRALRIGE